MGIRTNIDLSFQVGRNNALSNLAFDGDLQLILDTLEFTSAGTAALDAGETNYVIPFGDVVNARLIYVESTGPFSLTPGGGLSIAAQADGAGGSFATGFVGGETLTLEVNNVAVPVVFDVLDQTLAQVINRINSAAALAGVTDGAGVPATVARDNGSGQLRFVAPTTGIASEIDIQSGTSLATLGLTVAVTNGTEATAGQAPLRLALPSSVRGDNVRSFALMTLQTGGLTINNLDPASGIEVTYAVCGDLVTTPVGC